MAASEYDPLLEFGATVTRPGMIWACGRAGGRIGLIEDETPEEGEFRWLHLNLADARSLRWTERCAGLPPAIHALFVSQDGHQRVVVDHGAIGLVLHDFERDFDQSDSSRTGALHIALTETLMLTGRYHPLASADLVKRRIADGMAVEDAPTALDLILGAIADSLGRRALDVSADLLATEDDLLAENIAPDTRELVGVRRTTSQLHRMVGGMRATLHHADGHSGLPKALAPVVARYCQRLGAIDADVVSAQTQLRLLRDELDLQAAQRTNENVYFLSIITALMMPATLVTGFFGMNTSGLPFSGGGAGTFEATLIALAASAATYFALRTIGLVKR
jgi:Mg2+ and Co2+ transporter CorA